MMNQEYPAVLVSIYQLSVWLLGLVVIFVPLERLFAVHPHKILRKGIGVDLLYYYINNLIPAVILTMPIAALAWAARLLTPQSLLVFTASLPLWARAIAGLVASEFGYYWGHRWCHEIPFLWRFHAVHHSAEDMDFLVHTRAHPLDMVFGRLCGLVPLYVLGLAGPVRASDSLVPIFVILFGTAWGFFIHSNVRWRFGPLERLISTPAFHHWHHTRSGPIDRNFSSTLPWLDWIFGSLYLPKEWPEDYGVRNRIPEALVDQLVHPFFPPEPERVDSTAQEEEIAAPVESSVS